MRPQYASKCILLHSCDRFNAEYNIMTSGRLSRCTVREINVHNWFPVANKSITKHTLFLDTFPEYIKVGHIFSHIVVNIAK